MIRIFVALVCVLPIASTALAVPLFDNFGGSFSPDRGSYMVGPTSPNPPILPPVQRALSFEVDPGAGAGPWRLTSIEVPLLWQTYGSDSVEVHLHLDGGGVPGTRVASAIVPDVSSATGTLREAVFSGSTGLLPATTYWVVVNSVEDGEHTWQYVDPRIEGDMYYWLFNDGGPWILNPGPVSALRVNGVVDESVSGATSSVGAMKTRFK